MALFDNVNALRRHTLIVVGKRSKSRPMLDASVGDDVYDWRGVTQMIELIRGQKTCSGKIGFLPQNAIQLNGVTDRTRGSAIQVDYRQE